MLFHEMDNNDNNDDSLRCVVGGCKYNPKSGQQVPELNDTIKFYNFPIRTGRSGDKLQWAKWVEFVRISLGLNPKSVTSWTPSSGDKICSTHFIRNCKSEHPGKSNYAPTIYPECLHGLPPPITYDLRDLVCWWIKEGEQNFSHLFPIVEAEKLNKPVTKPKPNEKSERQEQRELKSFTLVEVDVTLEPHPFVKTYIRVEKDLSFRAFMKNIPVPAHALLGDNESVGVFGSVYEFQCALNRLGKLNPCHGTSTSGLKGYPRNMKGKVVKLLLNGNETERLVSNECEIVAAIKVCDACKKLWSEAFRCKRYERQKKSIETGQHDDEDEEIAASVEERLSKCERVIENYKAEVCRLMAKNKELKDRILVFKEALRQEVGQNMDGREGGKKRTISDVDNDIEVGEEIDGRRTNSKRSRDMDVEDNGAVAVDIPTKSSSILVPKQPARKTAALSGQTGVVTQTSVPQLNKAVPARKSSVMPPTPQEKSAASTAQQKSSPSTTQQQKPIPSNPQQKVLKITREQALLLRKLTSTSASGNVIRVQATQLATINKILGRPNEPTNTLPVVGGSNANVSSSVSTQKQKPPLPTSSTQVQKSTTPPTKQQVIRVVDNRKTTEDEDKSSTEQPPGESADKKIFNVKVVQK